MIQHWVQEDLHQHKLTATIANTITSTSTDSNGSSSRDSRAITRHDSRGQRTFRELFRTGYVSVILWGGGFGESSMCATHLDLSSSRGCDGNNEHVWPSGPTPSRAASKHGNDCCDEDEVEGAPSFASLSPCAPSPSAFDGGKPSLIFAS